MSGLITKKEVFNLVREGVNQANVSIRNVSLESDKYLVVRDKESGTVTIVDFTGVSPVKSTSKMSGDSAIMNPSSKVLALRDDASSQLQVWNLDMRQRVTSATMSEPVEYWRWISESVIAIVTATAVFHWTTQEGSQPVKVFERDAQLASTHILGYRVDASMSWMVLVALQKKADNSLAGLCQVYSKDRNKSMVRPEQAGLFLDTTHPDTGAPVTILVHASNNGASGSLSMTEIPVGDRAVSGLPRQNVAISFSSPQDFPMALLGNGPRGIFYLVTRSGFVYVYCAFTLTLLCSEQIVQEAMFATTPHKAGFLGVTSAGSAVYVSVDDVALVRHAASNLQKNDLALRLASASGASGADALFQNMFNHQLSNGDIEGAIKTALKSPGSVLRNESTLNRLQSMTSADPNAAPLKLYFKVMLEKPPLNAIESLFFARVVMARPQGATFLADLLNKNSVTPSTALGELLQAQAPELALRVFRESKDGGGGEHVMGVMIQQGDFEGVIAEATKGGASPNWLHLMAQTLNANAEGGQQLASAIYKRFGTEALDPNRVVDLLVQRRHIKQATGYLLDILGDRDAPEDSALQTRLLEVAIQYAPPQVPDKILAPGRPFTQYDKGKVSALCEKAGLFNRALEIYSRLRQENPNNEGYLTALKRCITQTSQLGPDFVSELFGNLSQEDSLVLLKELMETNAAGNFKLCVTVAANYADRIGAEALIELFLNYNAWEALFYFLQGIVNTSKDREVHFRYIEASIRMQQYPEVERVTRESDYYEPERVKSLLKEARLPDLWPLINVCDKHDMVDSLIRYLYDSKQEKYIENYVQKRAPQKLPAVAGALLDCDAPEDYVRILVMSIGGVCPVEPLVEAFESRNRLRLLRQWLEAQKEEGNSEPVLFNALGKIYVDANENAEYFLTHDEHYDKRVLGKYCENREPTLAFIAYSRGHCDDELVEMCTKHCMYKPLAKYLVDRQDADLWKRCIGPGADPDAKKSLIDVAINSVLPDVKVADAVIVSVRAFVDAGLQQELMDLLEKIVLGPGEFRNNPTLSTLLLQKALEAGTDRIYDFISRLELFDVDKVEVSAREHQRWEELFHIFKKTGKHNVAAVKVLVTEINDVGRARDFADRLNDSDASSNYKEVWSVLGSGYLKSGDMADAVVAFSKAQDADVYLDVIEACHKAGAYAELVQYLLMCRSQNKRAKQSVVDTELVYCYARTGRLGDLEEFVTSANATTTESLLKTGDKLMEEGVYEAARILFSTVVNYPRLALCLVKLERYDSAVEACQKASSIKTWKEVCFACVEATPPEFRLAQQCALNVIVHADDLDEIVRFYEERGLFDEIVSVLQRGLDHERAHMGLFTELGVLYARHKCDKLVDHIKRFYKKIHHHKLTRICEQYHLWLAARWLYSLNDEHDNAINCMLENPGAAWEHDVMKESVAKGSGADLCYKVIHFYVDYNAELLADFLSSVSSRLDPSRVVQQCKNKDVLHIAQPYFKSVQESNVPAVNDALNNLYIEQGDYVSLSESVAAHNAFDQIALAQKLEKHGLVEFRRVAISLYRQNSKWAPALDLAKKDKLYKDATEVARASNDRDLVEDLLRWYVAEGLNECFSAALYTCYDLVRPDVVIELSWRHNITDMGMPFVVQLVKDLTTEMSSLTTRLEKLESGGAVHAAGPVGGAPPPLAIQAAPGMMGGPAMGGGMMGGGRGFGQPQPPSRPGGAW